MRAGVFLLRMTDQEEQELNDALFSLVQELKIANNEKELEVYEARKRAEEAGLEMGEKIHKAFGVAVYGTALLATTTAIALTAANVLN